MKTKTYSVYSFDELSPKARERAISDHRQFLGKHFDSEPVIEDAKMVFAHAGFDIAKVFYSGFSCQGDGACFEGSWKAANVNPAAMREYAPIDKELHRIADELAMIAKMIPEAGFMVKHFGHYYHEYCTDFTMELPEADLSDNGPYATPEDEELALTAGITEARLREDRANEDLNAAEKALVTLARDAMRWIYKRLEEAYDYDTEEAQIIESIKGNEYEFTEDGEIDP